MSIQTLCGLFGKSRQAWYDAQKQSQKEEFHNLMLLSEIRRLRLDLPSVGVDVLHHQLTEFRLCHGIKVGRDKLSNLLRENSLLMAFIKEMGVMFHESDLMIYNTARYG